MASTGGGAAGGSLEISKFKTTIYDECLEAAEGDSKFVVRQSFLTDLDIVPGNDIGTLLRIVQGLIDDKLFKLVSDQEGVGWRLRSAEDAKKYRTLKSEQEIVYSLIDEAGDEGIWSKTIKAKSNLHDAVFRAAIKHLESRGFIADMKSVEHPTRKMYIKSSIRPSERATGGPWYTDSELDEEFIDQLMNVLYEHIRLRTFYRASSTSTATSATRKPKKVVKKLTNDEIKALKDKNTDSATVAGVEMEEIEEPVDERSAKRKKFDHLLPMPPGYFGYPTLNELTSFIDDAGISTMTLTAADISQLLDLLCYEGRIERVVAGPSGIVYKAQRKTLLEEDMGPSTVLSEAPCGRCPVFHLCEEGGPVGPSNCEYFTEWLAS